ncbi:MAG: TIM barrel protein [Candidatus Aenigmarchaeota archaeon]|nr:TIM barrel protein [Candidatus Aenigmarchaeota archaeon]
MICLGPGGLPTITKGDTIQGLKDLHSIGLNFMELEFVHSIYLKKDKAIEIGKAAKELGIGLSVHGPYYVNFGNPEKFAPSKKRILDSCEIAHHLGAKYVVFHPGFYGKLAPETVYKMVLKNCLEIQEVILSNNWDVKLGLETTGKKSQFGTLDELIRICSELKVAEPVIDFSHIYARQGGHIDYKEVLDKVKHLKHLHTHFSNIEYTDAGERRHLPLGTAGPDFEELAREIVKRNIDITIICETPLLEQDSLKMKGFFEEIQN